MHIEDFYMTYTNNRVTIHIKYIHFFKLIYNHDCDKLQKKVSV